MHEELPVIAIHRNERADLENCPYPVRTQALADRGARVIMTGGRQESAPDEAGVIEGTYYEVVHDPRLEKPLVVAHTGQLAVHATLNVARRARNHNDMPTLNDYRVREVTGKQYVYTELLADLSPNTEVVTAGMSADEATDKLGVTDLVVKPADGLRGKDVKLIQAHELPAELSQRFLAKPAGVQVVQERIVSEPWSRKLKASDPEENYLLQEAKKQEMRLFAIGDVIWPIARVVGPTDEREVNHAHDRYVALDERTIPAEVYTIGSAANCEIKQASGIGDIAVAIDLMYGRAAGDDEARWYLAEVNTVDPQFPSRHQYPGLSKSLHSLRSLQLFAMAKSNR